MKVQAKTNTAPAPTKPKSNSKVIEPEATNVASPKKSYKEYSPSKEAQKSYKIYEPMCDTHPTYASPGQLAQLFQQLKGKIDKRTV